MLHLLRLKIHKKNYFVKNCNTLTSTYLCMQTCFEGRSDKSKYNHSHNRKHVSEFCHSWQLEHSKPVFIRTGNSWIVILSSSSIITTIFFLLSTVLAVRGLPLRALSRTWILPAENSRHHFLTCWTLIADPSFFCFRCFEIQRFNHQSLFGAQLGWC